PQRAARICEFLELLPHIKGKWARERRLLELDPWQCFILTTVFGWVHRETGLRRFREVYLEVPRKNAKSTLSSGVALYMLTAGGAREQSLLWNITTAGTDRSGICYERRTHVTKVLDRVVDDPSTFGIIYSIDEQDDPFVESSWAKANPNWGVSVLRDDMEAAARKAASMPSALNNFLTKRLNVWVNGESPWMDMRAWERCADKGLRLEDF